MNYQKIYNNFIQSRLSRSLEAGVYYETHHITPRSLGGSDESNNLIQLTARDHYFAHMLLAKFAGPKMKIALSWFVNGTNVYRYGRKRISSRIIARIREDSNVARSETLKGRQFSEQHRAAISSAKKGTIPWNKGLSVDDPRVCLNVEKSKQTKQSRPSTPWNKGMIGEKYKQHYKSGLTPPSMTGRMWINDGTNQRKIMNTDPIPEGWSRGRCDIKGDNNPTRKKLNESKIN